MKKKNKLIIIITIVLILAVASVSFGFLYLKTDIFKSGQEVFFKYLSQNIEMIDGMFNVEKIDADKYESNINLKTSYSEGGEISNPFNKLSTKINIQKDNQNQYTYIDGKILYDNENALEAELIKEADVYGIRFTDAIKQFVSIKKGENTEAVANDLGLDSKIINLIMDSNLELNVSETEIDELTSRYIDIITQELMKGNFQKQKNAMITYDNVTTKTNAYSVSLTSEQVQDMILKVIDNIKTDVTFINDEIAESDINSSDLKITVYEHEQKTIRTVIELGDEKIVIENRDYLIKINYSNINSEKNNNIQIEINTQNSENQKNINIKANIIEDEENNVLEFSNKFEKINNNINIKSEIKFIQGITTMSLLIENETEINKEFEKAETLNQQNNVIISSLEAERRQSLLNVLGEIIPEKIGGKIYVLGEKLGIIKNQEEDEANKESPIEISKFNSKFEFYSGDDVSAENVKVLLGEIQKNLSSYEIIQEEENEIIKINIEKGIINEEYAKQIQDKIQTNKKYRVSIFYNEENGIIDYITIKQK